jgi:hypothetical protein
MCPSRSIRQATTSSIGLVADDFESAWTDARIRLRRQARVDLEVRPAARRVAAQRRSDERGLATGSMMAGQPATRAALARVQTVAKHCLVA